MLPVPLLRRLPVAGLLATAALAVTAGPAAAACPVSLTGGLCLPNDPSLTDQWGMDNTGQRIGDHPEIVPDADVDAAEAWSIERGSNDVVVAVVDTGIAYDNPDLEDRIWHNAGEMGTDAQGRDEQSNGVDDDGNGYVDDWQGWDFVGGSVTDRTDADNDPRDPAGHGTHVAGIIGATGNDNRGVTGVNWNVRLMNLRVRGERSNELGTDVADAFDYAADNGASIVNASLAETEPTPRIEEAIAAHPDVLYVIAAGNLSWDLDQQPGHPSYPCLYHLENVLCVAASTLDDKLAAFSSYGRSSVDLAAPGQITRSSQPRWQTVYTDPFESDPFASRWTAGGAGSAWGWSTAWAVSGSHSVFNKAAGGADQPGSDTWIQSTQPVDLRGRTGCVLSTQIDVNDSPGAGLYIQAGGDPSFMTASRMPAQDTSHPDNDTVSFVSQRITKSLGVSISDHDGQRSVYFRYGVLASPGAQTSPPRVYLDDMTVQCLGGTPTGNETAWMQGTSMASPLVAGIAALVEAHYPHETIAQVKDDLLRAIDRPAGLAGKVATGGRINAYKALARSSVGVDGGTLAIVAGAGERNHFRITRPYTDRIVVEDAWSPLYTSPMGGSRLVAGPQCGNLSDTKVTCSTDGVSRVTVDAGDLDDSIDTVDGTVQQVTCGPGTDTLQHDRTDVASGCETASVKSPPAPPTRPDPDPVPGVSGPVVTPTPEPTPQPTATPRPIATPSPPPSSSARPAPEQEVLGEKPARDTTAPAIKLGTVNRVVRLTRGGTLRFRCGPMSEPVRGTASFRSRDRILSGRRVAHFGAMTFNANENVTVFIHVRLSKADKALVRRRGSVKTRADLELTDDAGNRAVRTFVFTLKRPR